MNPLKGANALKAFGGTCQWSASEDVFINTISTPTDQLKNSLVFIKSKKFFSLFLEHTTPQTTSLILGVGEKVFEDIKELAEFKEAQEKSLLAVFTFSDIDLALCLTSKYFYDQLQTGTSFCLDGRKDGSASISPTANIAEGCFIGTDVILEDDVRIHSGVTIEGPSIIGKGTEIYPGATIYPRTTIGANCRIHGGVTLGGDGFGYHFHQGKHEKIWHFGGVEIGNNVEIGAFSAVDQGTFRPTRVGEGTKIDNHVQIAHNCQVGKHVILCGHSGLSGSVKLGDYCVLGGKAGVAPDVTVGSQSQIAGNGMVTGNLAPGSKVAGHPARPVGEWMRSQATLRKLSRPKGNS